MKILTWINCKKSNTNCQIIVSKTFLFIHRVSEADDDDDMSDSQLLQAYDEYKAGVW